MKINHSDLRTQQNSNSNNSFEILHETAEKITHLNKESFILSFIDIEDEEIEINDKHDFEYMKSNIEKDMPFEILIKPKEGVKIEGDQEVKKIIITQENEMDKGEDLKILSSNQKIDILKDLDNDIKQEPVKSEPTSLKQILIDQNLEDSSPQNTIENNDFKENLKITEDNLNLIKSERISRDGSDSEGIINKEFKITDISEIGIKSDFNIEINETYRLVKKHRTFDKFNKKQIFEQVLTDHPKLKQIENKIDLLNEILKDGFSNIKNDISRELILPSQIEEKKSKPCDVKTEHVGVACDVCKTNHIKGKRFKCLICENFDLCQKCEAKSVHNHPMLRFNLRQNYYFNEELFKLNIIHRKFLMGKKKDIKRTILENLTEKKYPDTFYKSLLSNFENVPMEKFIMEMISIFA